MNRGRKTGFWTAGVCILCGVAFVSCCIVQSLVESWRARKFLEITSTMRPGTVSEVDALNALGSFGPGKRSTVLGEPLLSRVWDEKSRSFLEASGRGYSFDNSGLRFAHLASKKAISGTLFFREGRLVSTWLVQVEAGPNAECYVRVLDAAPDFTDLPARQDGTGIMLDREPGRPATLIRVNVYPGATQSDRSKAYALNPARLVFPFLCHDAWNLIPRLSR